MQRSPCLGGLLALLDGVRRAQRLVQLGLVDLLLVGGRLGINRVARVRAALEHQLEVMRVRPVHGGDGVREREIIRGVDGGKRQRIRCGTVFVRNLRDGLAVIGDVAERRGSTEGIRRQLNVIQAVLRGDLHLVLELPGRIVLLALVIDGVALFVRRGSVGLGGQRGCVELQREGDLATHHGNERLAFFLVKVGDPDAEHLLAFVVGHEIRALAVNLKVSEKRNHAGRNVDGVTGAVPHQLHGAVEIGCSHRSPGHIDRIGLANLQVELFLPRGLLGCEHGRLAAVMGQSDGGNHARRQRCRQHQRGALASHRVPYLAHMLRSFLKRRSDRRYGLPPTRFP